MNRAPSQRIGLGRLLLLIALLISLVGASAPTLLYDGAAFTKHLVSQDVRNRANEAEIEQLSADYLFGDGHLEQERLDALSKESSNATEETFRLEQRLHRYEKWLLITLIGLLAVCCLFNRRLADSWLTFTIALIIGAYLLLQAWGTTLNGGKGFSEIAIIAHSARWGTALVICLYILIAKFSPQAFTNTAHSVIRYLALVVCAATFGAHGWEAINHYPPFQDLILATSENFGITVAPFTALAALTAIGIMDLALAMIILLYPHRALLLWMFVWGLVTALSRPLSIGPDVWYEVAVRAGNFMLPLYLAYIAPRRSDTADKSAPSD